MTTFSLSSTSEGASATASPPIKTDVPVLISGAGPTGLLAGILLAKMGIRTHIIERDMTVSPLSKAFSLHPRTLEILRQTGQDLSTRFEKESWESHMGRMYFGGKLTAELKWTPAMESQFHHTWGLPQTSTVRLLTEEYEGTGMGCIDRGWELVDTKVVEDIIGKQTTSWVETTIRRAVEGTNARKGESAVLGTVEQAGEDEGKQYEIKVIKSDFLIGSDGGRSTVRHVLNIPFPGRTRDANIILFDGHIDTDLPLDEMASINGSNLHAVGMFPLYGNRVRFLLSDGTLTAEEFAARKVKTPTKEYFERLLEETVTPHKVKILSYNWLTYYRANERRATEFVHKQRIILAGDAAHTHSPMGGQGLNMGLQDSYNLAWKITMVLKGTAPLSLIDSYNDERTPIADEIIQLSSKNLNFFVSESYWFFQARKFGLALLSYLMPYLPTGSGGPTFAMLGLRYYKNSLNKEHPTHHYAPTAPASIGRRAPDDVVYPLAVESSPLRLYNLMDTLGAFQILVFTADRQVQELGLEAALFTDVEHYQRSWLARWPGTGTGATTGVKASQASPQFMVYIISHPGLDATVGDKNLKKKPGYGKIYLDSKGGDLHRRYGITSKGGIVVVRPDTHVSYRVESIDKAAWVDVDKYFESILCGS
ncbi:FAD binding domain-containing protein [Linnemannia elongata]|nr:FAD binding domain-containing protein [Linnemannia elongata]